MSFCPHYQKHSGDFCQYWSKNKADNDNIGFCKRPKYFRCIEKEYLMKEYISQSQLADWNTCRRLYYLKHILGISRRKEQLSFKLKMGVLWDVELQYIYSDLPNWNILFDDIIKEYDINSFDIAKVEALAIAHEQLINPDFTCDCQVEIISVLDKNTNLKGVLDRVYDAGYFVESKLTGRPDFFKTARGCVPQIPTYFLLENFKEFIIEVTRMPDIKIKDGEEAPEYQDRVLRNILTKPKHYFIGLDRDKGMYGIRYRRNDFFRNIKDLKESYIFIVNEIKQLEKLGDIGFYEQHKGCYFYSNACDYISICENERYVSEELYEIIKQGESK